uniref:Urocortin n=1 Tax=Gopherus evgoodei TaxID=1825980 RepID=A0A8C4VZY1_9SAUR
ARGAARPARFPRTGLAAGPCAGARNPRRGGGRRWGSPGEGARWGGGSRGERSRGRCGEGARWGGGRGSGERSRAGREEPPLSIDLTFHLLRHMLDVARAQSQRAQAEQNRLIFDSVGK